MIKRIVILALSVTLCATGLYAQTYTGGVTGVVVSRTDKAAIEGATLELYSGAASVATVKADAEGKFSIPGLQNGMYDLVITAPDFLETRVNVTVNDGFVKNMFNLSMTPAKVVNDVDDASFAEFDMDDSGYNDSPTILFGQNDVFNNIAGYNFNDIRFRVRGYSSESQEVYLAGVKMNDAITGYTPYSLWSGLNEAVKSKSSAIGSETSEFGLGGYNGLTNIYGTASNVRTGWRGSVLTNSALYRMRVMLTYSSGMLDNGWSYALSASARLGGNDWVDGVFYRSFGYYASVEKKFNDVHKFGAIFMAAPGERGAQNASTQEVYDLMDDNMYNSNWGYQNGKVRNSRVRKTHEPIAVLKWDFTPSEKFSGFMTVLYRFGKNGYTALDWYDALDPRPDYYRNLPSYFYDENPDMNRQNQWKAAAATESWLYDKSVRHLDWDRLYNVNYNSASGRSKYIQEERMVNQQDGNFATAIKWRPKDWLRITGGLSAKVNRTEYYKKVADLLGGEFYLNINQFAERDYAADQTKYQNDLDYYYSHGLTPERLHKGDKYGYDYYAYVINAGGWLNGDFSFGRFSMNLGGKVGNSSFWREGRVRNGLFPEDSKGCSDTKSFTTYAGKLGLNYVINGKMRVYGNVGYYGDAPTFNQSFISPRTKNQIMDGLKTIKTLSADLNYQFFSNGYSLRATGYYTKIQDQSKVMSFYDDLQNAFTNFALSGIDQRHIGVELGFKIPTPVENLALQGVLSYGEYIYTSNPYMTQTIDNSSEIVRDHELVPYWKSHSVSVEKDGKLTRTTKKHYVPNTPQLAASLGLSWNKNYWFIDADVDFFDKSYLDMNPLYRTQFAVEGLDGIATGEEIDYMARQEAFDHSFLLNVSIGKSWYIQRKYQIGFSAQGRNLLNTKDIKTGGYEQNRLVDNTVSKERYYKFASKYFYMPGANYMLNIYFRF